MHQLPGFVALFVLVTSVAFAQSTADSAVALENTPIYVVADASRTPLRVAAQGTVFRVLQEDGDWTRVQFTDPQWGQRVGYVQTKALRFSRPDLEPMDLSVRPAPAAAPASSSLEASPDVQTRYQAPAHQVTRSRDFERGWIDVNFGVAIAAEEDVSVERTYERFREDATSRVTYHNSLGASFDFGGGVMFTRQLGAGVSFGGTAHMKPADLYVDIPHPTVFNRHASDTAVTEGDLQRVEGAVHIQVMGVTELSRRARLRVFGGPTYFRVQQDLSSGITYLQAFNLLGANSVDITGTDIEEKLEGTGWGFHAGADFSFFFSRVVGIGAMARYSRGTVEVIEPAFDTPLELKAGGLQIGGGLRLKF